MLFRDIKYIVNDEIFASINKHCYVSVLLFISILLFMYVTDR